MGTWRGGAAPHFSCLLPAFKWQFMGLFSFSTFRGEECIVRKVSETYVSWELEGVRQQNSISPLSGESCSLEVLWINVMSLKATCVERAAMGSMYIAFDPEKISEFSEVQVFVAKSNDHTTSNYGNWLRNVELALSAKSVRGRYLRSQPYEGTRKRHAKNPHS